MSNDDDVLRWIGNDVYWGETSLDGDSIAWFRLDIRDETVKYRAKVYAERPLGAHNDRYKLRIEETETGLTYHPGNDYQSAEQALAASGDIIHRHITDKD